jgi:hypothetical protein
MAGQAYIITVTDLIDNITNSINVTEGASDCRLINSQCESSLLISNPATFTGAIETVAFVGALQGPSCFAYTGTQNIWFQYVGTGHGTIVSTLGSSFDTVLIVFRSPSASCMDLTCAQVNDDTPTTSQSYINFCAYAGDTYFIAVTSYDDEANVGELHFSLSTTGVPCTQPASFCQTSQTMPLNAGFITANTSGLYQLPSPELTCNNEFRQVYDYLLYNTTGTNNLVHATTCYSSYNPIMALYTVDPSCSSAQCRDWSEETCTLSWCAKQNQTYYLQLIPDYGEVAVDAFAVNISGICQGLSSSESSESFVIQCTRTH